MYREGNKICISQIHLNDDGEYKTISFFRVNDCTAVAQMSNNDYVKHQLG